MKANTQDATDAPARTSKLADEIIATQSARSDLLKWKLLLVAGLGGTGLGLMEKGSPAPLLLALVPFACLYVDLLCTNLKLRMVVIGTYFATFHQDAYEGFVGRVRRVFDLEDWALYWSTGFLSLLVVIIGAIILHFAPAPTPKEPSAAPATTGPGAAAGAAQTPATKNPAAQGADVAGKQGDAAKDSTGLNSRSFQGGVIILAGLAGIIGSFGIQRKSRDHGKILATQVPLAACVAHNQKVKKLLRPQYSATDLEAIRQLLINKGTFYFRTLPNGLFPAAGLVRAGDVSGYQNVWVRDNVHVANSQYASGNKASAVRAVAALMTYFQKYRGRFQKIVDGTANPANAMERPHVRFDGEKLEELDEEWSHAQNDALGYFLWIFSKLARERLIDCGETARATLKLFVRYFAAIEFWKDADSGHWEETEKVEASSIGTVVAGLRELKMLLQEQPAVAGTPADEAAMMDRLIGNGVEALKRILPCEAREPADGYRRFDAALLFLIYPLEVQEVMESFADTILEDVTTHLQGEHGIRRYIGDSYWFADYKEKFPRKHWTANARENIKLRNALLNPGEEAQWCIFDSIISIIYGRRYERMKAQKQDTEALETIRLQAYYLNRALGQVTGKGEGEAAFRCPESYYLHEGRYMPNDQTPLLWSQANLWLALHEMQATIKMLD